jgi:hypothetical protein
VAAFVARVVEGGDLLIPWHVFEEVTLATFQAVERATEVSRPPFPWTGMTQQDK